MEIILGISTLMFAAIAIYFFVPWLKRRMEGKAFRKALKDKTRPLVHNHTDEDGNRWYIYKNVLDMPPRRAIAAQLAAVQANLCFTDEFFDRILAEIKQACNMKDLVTVAEKIGIIQQRRTWAGEIRTVQQLAHVYSILEGEDPSYCSDHWKQKKMKIWEANEAVHAFFLKSAFLHIRTLNDLSATDFINYLQDRSIEELQMMEHNYGKSSLQQPTQ